jgi:hypothetical protein
MCVCVRVYVCVCMCKPEEDDILETEEHNEEKKASVGT